jgi:4-hydroxy-tetrahydrodipicolinate reductase
MMAYHPGNVFKKKSIGIVGIAGRMGRAVRSLLDDHPLFVYSGGFDRICSDGQVENLSLLALFQRCDYVCDFSHPDLLHDIVRAASECPRPLLIGTTGHPDLILDIEMATRKAPVIIAPNTSIGAVIQRWISGHIASRLPNGFDVDITEAHHNQKVDYPSGTAKALATRIADVCSEKGHVMDIRSQPSSPRSADSIVIHAQRRGQVSAENTVIWTSDEEELSIRHTAFGQQKTFAQGVLSVFEWIYRTQPVPGTYTMEDVLGLSALSL